MKSYESLSMKTIEDFKLFLVIFQPTNKQTRDYYVI